MGCCIPAVDPVRPIPDDRDTSSAPEIVGAPTAKEWYYSNITNNEAEDRLRFLAKEDGNYLVYDFYTEAGPVPGEYQC